MTNTIEEIDLQIKELQEQKRRLIEKQKAEEEKVSFDVSKIVTSANQRMHKILLHHGSEEADQLLIKSNKNDLVLSGSLLAISLVNSSDRVLLSKIISVDNIHLFIDHILTNAVALAEVNRKFGSMMKIDDSYHDSIRLITSKSVEVGLSLSSEDNKFNISAENDLKINADKIVISNKDSKAYIELEGVCLSAKFVYKKGFVKVDEITEVLEEIDSEFDELVIEQF